MAKALLDTNVLIRYLTGDIPEQAAAARHLLDRAAAGDVELHVTALTFAEAVWVLEKTCGWSRADIGTRLPPLLGLAGVVVAQAPVLRQALSLYSADNMDFIDSYQGALALDAGIPAIYSFDSDLDRIPGIRRLEPDT